MPHHFFTQDRRTIGKITISGQSPKIYGFYQSTGQNSRYPDTWFPFKGISDSGWFIKPHLSEKDALECYDPLFLEFLRNHPSIKKMLDNNAAKSFQYLPPLLEEMLMRFGNVECLLISYMIGGGFWYKEEAIPVKQFLQTHYVTAVKRLKEHITNLDDFKNRASHAPLTKDQLILDEGTDQLEQQNVQKNQLINQYIWGASVDIEKVEATSQHFKEMAFDYIIDDPSIAKKFNLLCDECDQYEQYLIDSQRCYHQDTVHNQKLNALRTLKQIFWEQNQTSKEAIQKFTKKFAEYKSIFSQRRDHVSMTFIKAVLTILSFGLAYYCVFWRVQGKEFSNHLDEILNEPVQPTH